jgi:hypothetical protein
MVYVSECAVYRDLPFNDTPRPPLRSASTRRRCLQLPLLEIAVDLAIEFVTWAKQMTGFCCERLKA